jgi:hypothetical protein
MYMNLPLNRRNTSILMLINETEQKRELFSCGSPSARDGTGQPGATQSQPREYICGMPN